MDNLEYRIGSFLYKIDRKLEKKYDKINERYLDALNAGNNAESDRLLQKADRIRTWGTGDFEIFTKASAFSEVVADEYDWQTQEERDTLVGALYGLELFKQVVICHFKHFCSWLDKPCF